MQCKDIPDITILQYIARIENGEMKYIDCGVEERYYTGTLFEGFANSVCKGMPSGDDTPPKLALSKIKSLINRGLIDGCCCGCRGDFELTAKGREYLANSDKAGG